MHKHNINFVIIYVYKATAKHKLKFFCLSDSFTNKTYLLNSLSMSACASLLFIII